MSPFRSRIPVLAVLAAAALLAPHAVGAQQVDGVALGPEGQPLADVPVALHRVSDVGGSSVASATTDADGRFQFVIDVPDSAVYFAAMRYDGRMYIGPAIHAGVEPITGYELRAVPEAEAGAVAQELSGATGGPGGMGAPGAAMGAPVATGAAPADTGVVWLVALLALAAAAIFVGTAPGYRRRRTRETLIELATVENTLARGAAEGDAEELRRRRDHLRERLAPPA